MYSLIAPYSSVGTPPKRSRYSSPNFHERSKLQSNSGFNSPLACIPKKKNLRNAGFQHDSPEKDMYNVVGGDNVAGLHGESGARESICLGRR
jgi:hypothetical protein